MSKSQVNTVVWIPFFPLRKIQLPCTTTYLLHTFSLPHFHFLCVQDLGEVHSTKLDHYKSHWASCSIDLPQFKSLDCIKTLCEELSDSILRLNRCKKVADPEKYTYFERGPDGKVFVRPYKGTPVIGPKLLAVGPGSNPSLLEEAVARVNY